VGWALDAGVETVRLARQLPAGQRARVGQRAQGLTLDVTLFLPLGKVSQGVHVSGGLNPLQHHKLGDKVDIVVVLQGLGDPGRQLLCEPLVDLEPGGVEAETEGGPVGAVVPVKVVPDHPTKLFLGVDV